MTLQQTIAACKAELEVQAPRIVQTQAQTALALVTLRIQSQGLGAFQYSPTRVPVFFFYNKALNGAGRQYVKNKQKQKGPDRLGTWGEFRGAQGLPTDGVYLTYTGRMFRSLTTLYAGFTGTLYAARIVASDQEEANKVQWNMKRYGDFLRPIGAEVVEVQQVAQVELERIINRFFPQS